MNLRDIPIIGQTPYPPQDPGGGWMWRRAKKARESSALAAKLNAVASPSRVHRRKFRFAEEQFKLDQANPGMSRKERRRLARELARGKQGT